MTEPRHPMTAAFMARDLDGLVAAMAPDVLFRSPIISTPFRGKDELRQLYAAVFETFEDVELIEEIEDERRLVATFWLRFGRQPAKSLEFVSFGPDGLAQEIEIFVRPMAGVTALAAVTRHADPIASKLVVGRRETLR